MPSKPLKKSATRPSRPHPYRKANATSPAVDPWPTRATTPLPDLPPPPPSFNRELSMISVVEETAKKKFPSFVWKNDMEIILAVAYALPIDNETLRRRLDDDLNRIFREPKLTRKQATRALHETALEVRAASRSEILGAKPFTGQQTRTHPLPSHPSISMRLWTSSPSLKYFSMDFVETATGTSVNVFDRFKAYGGNYMVSGGPTLPLRPLSHIMKPMTGNCEVGEETYTLNEGQTVTIEDTKSKHKGADRFLSFEVPKHPGAIRSYPVPMGHTIRFSFDE